MKRRRTAGITLVEMMVGMVVAFIVFCSVATLLFLNQVFIQGGLDQVALQRDASLGITCVTPLIRDSRRDATDDFEIYSDYTSYSGGSDPVTDGNPGSCILLRQTGGDPDVVLYLDGDSIAKEQAGSPGAKVTPVDDGVDSLEFTAALDTGRTGAVIVDVTSGSGNAAVSMTSQVYVRND